MLRILVTGSKGMLGSDLVKLLKHFHNVTEVELEDLDICNLEDVFTCVKAINPEIIINCAAYTDVDSCEKEVFLAYKVNAIGPRNLAIVCNEMRIPLVHFSTDYVFNGTGGTPYLEGDYTSPINVYGKSKLEGENFIKCFADKYFIVRTQWLYGEHGNNFVKTILKTAKERDEIKVVSDQFGSPTYTKDLCLAIQKLIETKDYGTYHITNSEVISWYDFTKEILNLSNLNHIKLVPCSTIEYDTMFPRLAKRPLYSPLNNFYWQLIGFDPLRSYKSALKDYLT